MFREKKTLSLGAKDTKKERTLLRALVFESRGRKERQSRFHRAHTWSSTTRPRPTSRDSVVSIIPVVCFRRIVFAHVCMCVVRIMCFKKKRRFFCLFLGKKSSKIHHATRGKTNKVFLVDRVLAKTTKSETMSLFSSHPSHENRVRVRKGFRGDD